MREFLASQKRSEDRRLNHVLGRWIIRGEDLGASYYGGAPLESARAERTYEAYDYENRACNKGLPGTVNCWAIPAKRYAVPLDNLPT